MADTMTHPQRFRALMNGQAVDRLPRWEWAMWWDLTIGRWHKEGLPRTLHFSQVLEISRFFGLDPYQQFWFSTTDPTIQATQHHVEGIVGYMDEYQRVSPDLIPVAPASNRFPGPLVRTPSRATWWSGARSRFLLVPAHADGFFPG